MAEPAAPAGRPDRRGGQPAPAATRDSAAFDDQSRGAPDARESAVFADRVAVGRGQAAMEGADRRVRPQHRPMARAGAGGLPRPHRAHRVAEDRTLRDRAGANHRAQPPSRHLVLPWQRLHDVRWRAFAYRGPPAHFGCRLQGLCERLSHAARPPFPGGGRRRGRRLLVSVATPCAGQHRLRRGVGGRWAGGRLPPEEPRQRPAPCRARPCYSRPNRI
jgi:hypothetical protein